MDALSLLTTVDITVKKGVSIMINKTFEKPTQVKISIIGETNSETSITEVVVIGAIAYNNFIIRADTGEVININTSATDTTNTTTDTTDTTTYVAAKEIYLIKEYPDWVDFNEEIRD